MQTKKLNIPKQEFVLEDVFTLNPDVPRSLIHKQIKERMANNNIIVVRREQIKGCGRPKNILKLA